MGLLNLIGTAIEALDILGHIVEGGHPTHHPHHDANHHLSHHDAHFGDYQFSDEHIAQRDLDVKVDAAGQVYKSPGDYNQGVNAYSPDPHTPLNTYVTPFESPPPVPPSSPSSE